MILHPWALDCRLWVFFIVGNKGGGGIFHISKFFVSFSWLFSFSRHLILFCCSLINWRRGVAASSMASDAVDLIADFNSLITFYSSALISFNNGGTIFLIKSGFNKVSWTSLDMLNDSPWVLNMTGLDDRLTCYW